MNEDRNAAEGRPRASPPVHMVRLLSRAQAEVFRPHPWASLFLSIGLYAAVVLVFGEGLGISSNYFVLVPAIVAALGFGSLGGLVAGALGLPSNLLLFHILGHPEFSPASKLIAEISGITVGFVFGGLSDHFKEIRDEMERRRASEVELRRAIEDKDLLLRELNHRVRNNLGVVKGLVRLQKSCSRDPAFIEAADELIGRIFAISIVQDELDIGQDGLEVGIASYLRTLASSVSSSFGKEEPRLLCACDCGRFIPVEGAVSLGLIVNEALAETFKHACRKGTKEEAVTMSLDASEGFYRIRIEAGEGAMAERESGPGREEGLGMKLMRSLAESLGGDIRLDPAGQGLRAAFELRFPVPA
ncbi:MAG TPA: sensor histidine kinase [Rectinemataceae bacterium]|nr:sensor histidine kinase [Rectinemataceae bacterium]